jgi:hypothetical protein
MQSMANNSLAACQAFAGHTCAFDLKINKNRLRVELKVSYILFTPDRSKMGPRGARSLTGNIFPEFPSLTIKNK